MDQNEKLISYATAPKAYAGTITQIENGDFVTHWVGKLRGKIVSAADGCYKFASRDAAVECARNFRERCRQDAAARGLAL